MANNLLMLGLSYFRHKLFEFQAFHNQAHIINFTGIIIYFCGTYYLYALLNRGDKKNLPTWQEQQPWCSSQLLAVALLPLNINKNCMTTTTRLIKMPCDLKFDETLHI